MRVLPCRLVNSCAGTRQLGWRTTLCSLLFVHWLLLSGLREGANAQPATELWTDQVLHQLLFQDPNQHIQLLGQVSDAEGSLVRTFMSPAHMRSAALIRKWMREAGMLTWMDNVGNVHGRVEGRNGSAPVLLLGSHYDTVVDAGKYDGALGILVGIAAIKAAVLQAAAEQDHITKEQLAVALEDGADLHNVIGDKLHGLLENPVELIAFSDEEGLRFQTTFLGSRAVSGALVKHGLLKSTDHNGMTVAEVLQMHGFDGSEQAISQLAMDPAGVRGYVEVHLEQGPVLEAKGLPLAPVSAIAGQTRLSVSVLGSQGHAGTVPMSIRRDPVSAAAESIAMVERRCGGGRYAPDNATANAGFSEANNLVCTVGSVTLWPGASNVIAGSTNFTIDIRCRSDAVRQQVVQDVVLDIENICQRRGIACRVEKKHEAAATHCDAGIIADLVSAARDSEQVYIRALRGATGVSTEPHIPVSTCTWDTGQAAGGPAMAISRSPECQAAADSNTMLEPHDIPVLVSGAGHDALAIAELTKIGMLFVRCRGGFSHSALEHVSEQDVAAATASLYVYLQRQLLQPMAQAAY
ncbi:hypothetical protein WJX72_008267 [[Myrmecia] bisecta]|uniref:Allantoate amidohydrolase n=1 Tax=[Myrmecia] bisecta TaxID=41462 RepID=A0AAW1R8J2_9CHLO